MGQNTELKQRAEKLVAQLMLNEHMIGPIEAMLEQVHSEQALGRKADDMEQIITKQIRLLGHASLQHWAHEASRAAKPRQQAHRHAKKNSGG